MSTREETRLVVEHFMKVFSTGDAKATTALMADTATWWVAGTTPISGTYDLDAFGKLLQSVTDNCTGPIKLIPKAYTVDGERVAAEVESLTQTKAGRTYNNHYHFLFLVQDGKIAGVREYLDTMHANAVLCTP